MPMAAWMQSPSKKESLPLPNAESIPAPQEQGAERRLAPRFSIDEQVQVHPISGATSLRGRIRDLSSGGCRLEMDTRFLTGAMLRVELQFQVRGIAFRLVGVTAGRRTRESIGIRFVDLNERRRAVLVEVLEELAMEQAAAAAGVTTSAANPPSDAEPTPLRIEADIHIEPEHSSEMHEPADDPSIQPSADAFRAAAAPQEPEVLETTQASSSDKIPADASEPEDASLSVHIEVPTFELPEISANSGAASQTRERRAHRRLKVDTRAQLHLVKTGICMHGSIQDLSMAGCRIVTQERFNVGIYVRIETEFYLHGLPFRLGGVSQAIINRNTIGVRFVDMSERKREQLMELISEIREALGEAD